MNDLDFSLILKKPENMAKDHAPWIASLCITVAHFIDEDIKDKLENKRDNEKTRETR